MPLVCPSCGAYALGNPSRAPGETTCSACGRVTPANIYPLCIVTGASGSGKTAVIPALRQRLPECVVFDKDLLWGRCIPWSASRPSARRRRTRRARRAAYVPTAFSHARGPR